MVCFVLGRPRYDVAAMLLLLVAVVVGLVPPADAFAGFGHPAVITVAAMLVISRGLTRAGIVETILAVLGRAGPRFGPQSGALNGLVGTLSAFMNDVGALAIAIPAGIRVARRHGRPPSQVLMPLAFASLMGGMVTLVGTPPNIIVATFRPGEPFGLFDFTPVGLVVALVGTTFISLVGWRLMPARAGHGARYDVFRVQEYTTELRVPADSAAVGMTVRELGAKTGADIVIVGFVRESGRRSMPEPDETVRPEDGLIVEGPPEDLERFVAALGLRMTGAGSGAEVLSSAAVTVVEAVVLPESPLNGRAPAEIGLRQRYDVNLLAVARQGRRLTQRLAQITVRGGDVLLLQTPRAGEKDALARLQCVPLSGSDAPFAPRPGLRRAVLLFASAMVVTALGLLPVQIAFAAVAALFVLFGVVPLDEVYSSIEWPVVFLIAALLPVAGALESTGGTTLISGLMLGVGGSVTPAVTLVMVMGGTMLLANVVNKAAAIIMAPIAVTLAQDLGVSADPLLMGIAIGASSAFLTPVGHQVNMLVLGPGGYRFGDYWRLGLPLCLLVLAVSVPLILLVWPF